MREQFSFIRTVRAAVLGFLVVLAGYWMAPVSGAAIVTNSHGLMQIELSKPLIVHWRYENKQTTNLTPASNGQQVYLPLSSGTLISLRVDSGQLVWKTEVGGELSASPVADEHGIYIASESKDTTGAGSSTGGALRLLGRDTGVTLWVRNLPAAPRARLAMNHETIYGASIDGRIFAVRKSTGEIVWTKQIDSAFASQLTLIGSRLYIGAEDGKVYAFDGKSGSELWRYQTRGAIRGQFAYGDGTVYFGSADGYVYGVNDENGRRRWRTRTGAGVQSVLTVGNGLIATSLDNFAYFLALANGDRLWKRQLTGRLSAEPLATLDGVLFTPLAGDNAIVLNLKDGKQLNTLPLGDESGSGASPIIAGDFLIVTTRDGLLAFGKP